MSLLYLGLLVAFIGCMVLCDWRWRLAFFRDTRLAALLCLFVVVALLLWDAAGIISGTFFRGETEVMTGVELAPELPLEEPFFLFFLTYLTINLTSGARMLREKGWN